MPVRGVGVEHSPSAAQDQGTGSCHSLFRVADHDLLESGVLQDALLPFSQEHGINLPAEKLV